MGADDPFMIKINASDLEQGNLRPSQVVCDNIFTFLKEDADSEKARVTVLFYSKVTKLLKERILKIWLIGLKLKISKNSVLILITQIIWSDKFRKEVTKIKDSKLKEKLLIQSGGVI